ncbi:MAG: FkbM family methyltransferase [Phycisphaeraceae bacterium]|nr:MAG: FkbM family methyltransferase [Phycisphaeraceae bacterium]
MSGMPEPVNASSQGWSLDRPWLFRLALAWAKHAPRGKGALPRRLGRWLGRGMKVLIPTNAGAKLAVDPDNLDVYTTIALEAGAWDAHIYRVCAAVLRDGGVFYDIGANGGSVGIDVAKRTGGKAEVIAFEPQPSLAFAAAVSASANGFERFRVFSLMLGEADGEGTLYVPSHSIHASAVSREPGAAEIRCAVRSIDSLVAAGLPPPWVMKVDVEGGEMGVFKGSAETIRTHRPYLLFESDINMKRFGYTRRDLLAFLGSLCPYAFYGVSADRLLPIGVGGGPSGTVAGEAEGDVLAVPPGGEIPELAGAG